MTTFINAELKKSHDQRNIDKYEITTNITEIKINLPKNHHSKIHDDKSIILCKNVCKSVKNQPE